MTSKIKNKDIVDVHAHLVPVDSSRLESIAGVNCTDDLKLEIDGHPIKLQALYQADKLIAWMDEHGISLTLISIPPPLYRQGLDEDSASTWLGYLNDGLEKIAAQYSQRLKVLAHLPLEHPALAIAEAGRRQGQHYAGYSVAAGGTHTINFADDALRPLWQLLHQQNSFVFMHPGSCCDERLKDFYRENLLGNPYETAVAVSSLVFAGVADDFSDIDFCLAHCGGVVPAVAGRWQQGFDTKRPGVNTSREPPSVLLKRFYVDCIAHDPGLITLAEQVFGKDRLLFGSDWPFPMGLKDPVTELSSVNEETRQNILYKNHRKISASLTTN